MPGFPLEGAIRAGSRIPGEKNTAPTGLEARSVTARQPTVPVDELPPAALPAPRADGAGRG